MFRFGDGEGPFFDGLRDHRQHGSAGDSVQNLAIERVGYQNALFGNDMRVLRGSLGHDTAALHPCIIRTMSDGFIFHQRSIQQLRSFDVRPAPSQIRQRHHADAACRCWIIGKRPRLSKGQNRWCCVFRGKYEVTVCGRSARHLPIDHAFFDGVLRHELAADGQPSICIRRSLDAKFTQRACKPADMAVKIDEFAVKNGNDFIHRVRKEEATVEDGDLAFGFRYVAAV